MITRSPFFEIINFLIKIRWAIGRLVYGRKDFYFLEHIHDKYFKIKHFIDFQRFKKLNDQELLDKIKEITYA